MKRHRHDSAHIFQRHSFDVELSPADQLTWHDWVDVPPIGSTYQMTIESHAGLGDAASMSILQCGAIMWYASACEGVNNIVSLAPDTYLPCLQGDDGKAVLLSDVVEEIEHVVDLSCLKERFDSLSYTQLGGALKWLRIISAFNSQCIDAASDQDRSFESSDELQNTILKSLESDHYVYTYG